MAAVLEIRADAADVRAAFGALVGDARKAGDQLTAVARGGSRSRRQIEADEIAQARRDLASMQRDRVRAATARTAATATAVKNEAKLEADARKRAAAEEKSRTKSAAAEHRERVKSAAAAERDIERNAKQIASARRTRERAEARQRQRDEREETAQAKREFAGLNRARQTRARGDGRFTDAMLAGGWSGLRGAARAGRWALGAAGSAASDFLGQVQGVRQTAASRERLMNGAFFQAGITGADAAASRTRIRRFMESDAGRGIDGDELANALNRTQTETSMLNRAGGLDEFLANATLARNTYQDVGEVTRVGGILSNLGVRGGDNRATLMALSGIAQQGGIELSNVSSNALGPLVANINNAVADATRGGRQISAEERSRVVSGAAARGLAVAEVMQQSGVGPQRSLNALSMFETGLKNDNRVGNLRNSIHQRFGDRDFARLDRELFEEYTDARGTKHHRMKNTDGLQMGQRLLGVFGNDSTALVNALAGGGHGNPQAFTHPVREFLRGMSGTGEGGKTGFQRAEEMSHATLTEERVQQGQQMTLGEEQTRLTAQNEAHITAIMGNTEALRVANNLAELRARDPVKAALAQAVGGPAAEMALAEDTAARGHGGTVRELITQTARRRGKAEANKTGWSALADFATGGYQSTQAEIRSAGDLSRGLSSDQLNARVPDANMSDAQIDRFIAALRQGLQGVRIVADPVSQSQREAEMHNASRR